MSETYRKLREEKAQKTASKNTFAPNQTLRPAVTSAVPMVQVKTNIEKEYDMFKNCFELDVIVTIEKDLEEEAMQEK